MALSRWASASSVMIERQTICHASSGAPAEQHLEQSFGSLKPFLRENHRLDLALWGRDVAFFVQPIHGVPVKTLPRKRLSLSMTNTASNDAFD
jgi:hypothetical protein